MTIDSMSYFETLDVERALSDADIAAKDLIRSINALYDMLRVTEHATGLDALITTIEASSDLMDDIWGQVVARQESLEEADIEEERAQARELATACS